MRLKSRVPRADIELLLMDGWSPEIIAGDMKRENNGKTVVSHEVIYQWIYSTA